MAILYERVVCRYVVIYFLQAALGPAALDLIKSGGTAGLPKEEELQYAKVLLAVSVLSVVISAPLGALLIAITGPKLLTKSKEQRKYQYWMFRILLQFLRKEGGQHCSNDQHERKTEISFQFSLLRPTWIRGLFRVF